MGPLVDFEMKGNGMEITETARCGSILRLRLPSIAKALRSALTRLRGPLAALAVCALIASVSHAQGGSGLTGALQTLQSKKGGLPPGWTARIGKTKQGTMGEADPTTKTITLDPDAIKAVSPSLGSHGSNLSSVLYVVLLHEWYHAKEVAGGTGTGGSGQGGGAGGGAPGSSPPPYNDLTSPCGELRLIPGVAIEQCQLICELRLAGIGVSLDCALYNDLRRKHNRKASSLWATHCPGTYPGDIPPCECCL
jgi:hypothetical protein